MVSPLRAISELKIPRRRCIHINGLRIKDFVAPPMDVAIKEELKSFVEKRKSEGGAPTDF